MARKKRSTKKMRTKSGGVSAAARRKHGVGKKKSFPVFDRKSGLAAIRLRGHAKSAKQRRNIINRAARYAPAAAKKARAVDSKHAPKH
jgi:hypothetical protein